jgi:hypothetical protein
MTNGPDAEALAQDMIEVYGAGSPTVARNNAQSAASSAARP